VKVDGLEVTTVGAVDGRKVEMVWGLYMNKEKLSKRRNGVKRKVKKRMGTSPDVI